MVETILKKELKNLLSISPPVQAETHMRCDVNRGPPLHSKLELMREVVWSSLSLHLLPRNRWPVLCPPEAKFS